VPALGSRGGVVGGSKFAPNDEGERLRYAGYALFRRTGEAMTARAHLDQQLVDPANLTVGLGRQRAVVFCGDLNDEPAAATTQIVAGPTGSQIDPGPGRPSSAPMPTTRSACGTWRRCCPPTSGSPGSSRAGGS
jgi:hypothetical protein